MAIWLATAANVEIKKKAMLRLRQSARRLLTAWLNFFEALYKTIGGQKSAAFIQITACQWR